MIKVTVKQFTDAVRTGALGRLISIPKAIQAGYKNRKMPTAIRDELKLYEEHRHTLIEKHGGSLPKPDAPEYDFPAGRREEFEREHAELLDQTIDLPGDVLKLSDLLSGGLIEEDYATLEPFLTE